MSKIPVLKRKCDGCRKEVDNPKLLKDWITINAITPIMIIIYKEPEIVNYGARKGKRPDYNSCISNDELDFCNVDCFKRWIENLKKL